jgi:hypothetical protein
MRQGVLPGDSLSRVNGVPLGGSTFHGTYEPRVHCELACDVGIGGAAKVRARCLNLTSPWPCLAWFSHSAEAVARIKGLPRPIIIHFVTVLGSGANASAVMAAAQESSSVKLNVVGGGAGAGGGTGTKSVSGNILDEVATIVAKEGFRSVSY